MRNVFEPNVLELVDLGGDTHFVTDIQRQVEQFLMANNTTRQHLELELEKFGPRAVPGILSAAYAFHYLLEDKRQRDLSTLLARLVGSNAAAREMLVKSGIVEAPFARTRATAFLALQKLGAVQTEELDSIRKRALDNAYMDGDYRGALTLYQFLVAQQDLQCSSEVRYIAAEAFKKRLDIAPLYLDLALCCASQNTYEILMETIGKMDRKAKKFGEKIQEMSAASVTNLPEVLRAVYAIKANSTGYAHKGIQNLFTGPIRALFSESPERIPESGEIIRQKYLSLARFFWQCLGTLLRLEVVQQYFVAQISDDAHEFSFNAFTQLFFIQRKSVKFKLWATELLEELKDTSPSLYDDVSRAFDQYRSNDDDDDVIDTGGGEIE